MKTDNTFYLISQIKQLSASYIERGLKSKNIKGISSSHGDVLCFLNQRDGIAMSKIAEAIKKDKSTITTLISKLEKNGYVELRKNEADSRSTLVFLSEKGKSINPDFEIVLRELFEISKKDISEKEWDAFRCVLQKLLQNLNH